MDHATQGEPIAVVRPGVAKNPFLRHARQSFGFAAVEILFPNAIPQIAISHPCSVRSRLSDRPQVCESILAYQGNFSLSRELPSATAWHALGRLS